MTSISKPMRITSWVLQIIAAVILGQTLFFKFSGAEETKALFEVLGAEPAGRYATAVLELAARPLPALLAAAKIGLGLGLVSYGVIGFRKPLQRLAASGAGLLIIFVGGNLL